ncbi:hypothetical protein SRHO_G00248690 [Serrasalmus rhombeus]
MTKMTHPTTMVLGSNLQQCIYNEYNGIGSNGVLTLGNPTNAEEAERHLTSDRTSLIRSTSERQLSTSLQPSISHAAVIAAAQSVSSDCENLWKLLDSRRVLGIGVHQQLPVGEIKCAGQTSGHQAHPTSFLTCDQQTYIMAYRNL